MSETYQPRLIVIGVGGGGCNAITRLINDNVNGVEYCACNTDGQSLADTFSKNKIQLGTKKLKGQGAGMLYQTGRDAAIESIEQVKDFVLKGEKGVIADMAFIVTTLGGGTGSGATPVIVKAIHELNVLTYCICIKPFSYEGAVRLENANRALIDMADYCDILFAYDNDDISNDEPLKTLDKTLKDGDEPLDTAVRAISQIILQTGQINIDFMDIQTIFRNKNKAYCGIGLGVGENRLVKALRKALSNPLFKLQLTNASNCLVAACAKTNDLLTKEYILLQEEIHKIMPNAEVKPGYYPFTDYQVEGGLTVVLIVSGPDINYKKNYGEIDKFDISSQNNNFNEDTTVKEIEKKKTKTQKGSLPDYL